MILEALTPIFAIILLGFLISRTPISSQEVWQGLERLTYYLFFPALLVSRLSQTNFEVNELLEIGYVLGFALFVFTILFIGLRKFIARNQGSLSSVYQGSIRFNTYIGLACVEALYGDNGLTLAALCLVVYIPLVNVLSVISISASGGGNRWVVVTGSVLTNPLVLACLIGMGLSFYNMEVPDLGWEIIEVLSRPALPLGLLAVGAGIHFVAFGDQTWQLVVALFCKLLAFPALVVVATLLFKMAPGLSAVLLLLTCLPAPPSAYILARQLGGNVSLMANIITLQTLFAFFTIPLWVDIGDRFLWLNLIL
ncbi:MAG TPA: AEC family transporter [Gammaproteobacteria bacterium]|nr:MAG: AEC family transporter [Gammaproteobacteria bacterium TMED163]HAR90838.1 AEC family transporter [Gammaproteobacteria bacterium]HBJ89537.1 AEC family transporter [Gammaproteobacteria bacterium]HBQ00161.1 AEC family transporter [Gammaproteobacteria bacterium]HCA35590.1 AEC family transporter [Gammaproteobacteria bacterium]|tara:strand:+ start:207 stop:1136 length:930 start_codon:yes stop_codon:yes gene_type:complete